MEQMTLLQLTKEVKKTLNITWSHEDERIEEMIKEGVAFFENRVGPLKFLEESNISYTAKGLLKEYCRYAWSGAVNAFEEDYRHKIINLQLVVAEDAYSK